MTRRTEPKSSAGWLSKREMLALFDCSEQVFERSIRPAFDDEAVKMEGGRLRFWGRRCIEGWARVRAAVKGGTAGRPSAALERYRRARARLAEQELKARSEELVPADEVRAMISTLVDVLGRLMDREEQQCGARAMELVQNAIEEINRIAQAQEREKETAPADTAGVKGDTNAGT